jgi:hypothetical protein
MAGSGGRRILNCCCFFTSWLTEGRILELLLLLHLLMGRQSYLFSPHQADQASHLQLCLTHPCFELQPAAPPICGLQRVSAAPSGIPAATTVGSWPSPHTNSDGGSQLAAPSRVVVTACLRGRRASWRTTPLRLAATRRHPRLGRSTFQSCISRRVSV